MNSTLVIGLGETGVNVATRAYRYWQDVSTDTNSGLGILGVDFNPAPSDFPDPQNSFIHLDLAAADVRLDIESQNSKRALYLRRWLPRKLLQKRPRGGSRLPRPVERLAWFEQIGKVSQSTLLTLWRRQIEALDMRGGGLVFLVGSLEEPGGSSLLMDAAFLTRALIERQRSQLQGRGPQQVTGFSIVGCTVLPNGDCSPEDQIRAFAALRELDRAMLAHSPDIGYDFRYRDDQLLREILGEPLLKSQPFDVWYAFDKEPDLTQFSPVDHTIASVINALRGTAMNVRARSTFSNRRSAISTRNDRKGRNVTRLGTARAASLVLPIRNFQKTWATKLIRDTLGNWQIENGKESELQKSFWGETINLRPPERQERADGLAWVQKLSARFQGGQNGPENRAPDIARTADIDIIDAKRVKFNELWDKIKDIEKWCDDAKKIYDAALIDVSSIPSIANRIQAATSQFRKKSKDILEKSFNGPTPSLNTVKKFLQASTEVVASAQIIVTAVKSDPQLSRPVLEGKYLVVKKLVRSLQEDLNQEAGISNLNIVARNKAKAEIREKFQEFQNVAGKYLDSVSQVLLIKEAEQVLAGWEALLAFVQDQVTGWSQVFSALAELCAPPSTDPASENPNYIDPNLVCTADNAWVRQQELNQLILAERNHDITEFKLREDNRDTTKYKLELRWRIEIPDSETSSLRVELILKKGSAAWQLETPIASTSDLTTPILQVISNQGNSMVSTEALFESFLDWGLTIFGQAPQQRTLLAYLETLNNCGVDFVNHLQTAERMPLQQSPGADVANHEWRGYLLSAATQHDLVKKMQQHLVKTQNMETVSHDDSASIIYLMIEDFIDLPDEVSAYRDLKSAYQGDRDQQLIQHIFDVENALVRLEPYWNGRTPHLFAPEILGILYDLDHLRNFWLAWVNGRILPDENGNYWLEIECRGDPYRELLNRERVQFSSLLGAVKYFLDVVADKPVPNNQNLIYSQCIEADFTAMIERRPEETISAQVVGDAELQNWLTISKGRVEAQKKSSLKSIARCVMLEEAKTVFWQRVDYEDERDPIDPIIRDLFIVAALLMAEEEQRQRDLISRNLNSPTLGNFDPRY